jgi:hypothetical protein
VFSEQTPSPWSLVSLRSQRSGRRTRTQVFEAFGLDTRRTRRGGHRVRKQSLEPQFSVMKSNESAQAIPLEPMVMATARAAGIVQHLIPNASIEGLDSNYGFVLKLGFVLWFRTHEVAKYLPET